MLTNFKLILQESSCARLKKPIVLVGTRRAVLEPQRLCTMWLPSWRGEWQWSLASRIAAVTRRLTRTAGLSRRPRDTTPLCPGTPASPIPTLPPPPRTPPQLPSHGPLYSLMARYLRMLLLNLHPMQPPW